ncbi:arsenate reductase (glutaredoxin) [Legionella maioricensis]|uniref:Arsenate reductase n=1 Tax=Legionella maioricensis TaxID=2896528 RepID=A0A9X2I9U8_9GAMM|nr:arsenate reductase (glutaredoxin) [Legionella maioricensis]MCL9683539.1 arsenate reductase (glutaredoxin) [Legionella maioricensis]MCL9686838.1 arsenate reductase (glutaredoxin) [Legionella maioricensis]
MQKITIYHNPQCSKSRKTLEILQNKGLDPVIIEYLKTPLNMEQLNALRSHFALEDFVRTNEPIFQELGLSLDNEAQVLQAMLKEPRLMQRPIVTLKDKAIIGRPPENVLALIVE